MSDGTAAMDAGPVRGRLRVHVGILPGCGQRLGLLKACQVARQHGQKVAALTETSGVDGVGFPVWRPLLRMPPEQRGLWNPEVVELVLREKPDLVVFGSLNRHDLSYEQREAKQQNILRLQEAGIHLETTLDIVAVCLIPDLLNPGYTWSEDSRVSPSFLRKAVTEYVVHDLPPTLILQRFYEGQIALPPELERQRAVFTNVPNLSRLREALFMLVGNHVTDQVRATSPNMADLAPEEDIRWRISPKALVFVPLTEAVLFGVLYYLWKEWELSLTAVSLVLMGAVLLTALTRSVGTTLLAGAMTFAGLYWIFMEPQGLVGGLEGLLTLGAFLLVGGIVGYVASRKKTEARSDRLNAMHYRALLRLSYDLNTAESVEACLEAGVRHLHHVSNTEIFLAIPESSGAGFLTYPQKDLGEADARAVRESYLGNVFSRAHGEQQYSYCPMSLAAGKNVGTIGFLPTKGKEDLPYYVVNFLRYYGGILAGAIARLQLKQATQDASFQATREGLRSAILSSISHDLKTPLVGIIGSLSTVEHAGGLTEDERRELIRASRQEAQRLHVIIHNVLELTKLESGSLMPKREVVPVTEIIEDAMLRLRQAGKSLRIKVDVAGETPDLEVDPVLMGQVFYNLFDNAAKYAGVERPVEIRLETAGEEEIRVDIADHGPGIVPGDEERLFDKFFRAEKKDYRPAGSGLGLAICKGIVEAHGGKIRAANRPDEHGAVFSLWLPASRLKIHLPDETINNQPGSGQQGEKA